MPGLYVHVPFCARKCAYCDFASEPFDARTNAAERFLSALEQDLARGPKGFEPDTIFIGGGTPTVLPAPALGRLLDLVRRHVNPKRVVEWTCEANPVTLDAEKARLLRQAGVNRLSLGVQSFDDAVLSYLGRLHTAREAEEALALAREAGFDNLNLDLMFAVPEAPKDSLARGLEQIRELRPEHVSVYALIFEPGTPLTRRRDAGEVREVGAAVQARQYRVARRRLVEMGYTHYEISNYARPGFECRHNRLYWEAGEYLGCGPAAHSHWQGRRWGNSRRLEEYAAALNAGRSPVGTEERLEPAAKAREALVMGLRLVGGVDLGDFRRRTGFDAKVLRGPEIARLLELGMLEEDRGRLRLAEKALFISNAVFAELV